MDTQAEKVALLQKAALHYKQQLAVQAPIDHELAAVLRSLAPLFSDIALGRIAPPAEGLYETQFQVEHPHHGLGTSIYSAEAAFLSALLDWRSKPWFPK